MPAVSNMAIPSLDDLIPQISKGHDLKSEIECYSLPYGGLGFASHFLTYYTLFCLWFGRSPLWPWRSVKCSRWDLILALTGLVISTGLAIYTLVKCKNTWQLLVIAVWKLSMSLLNGITAVNTSSIILKGEQKDDYWWETKDKLKSTAWWIALYVPGMFAGMAGLMSLVVQNWHDRGIFKLTISFYSVIGFGMVLGILVAMTEEDGVGGKAFGAGLFALIMATMFFTVLAAFYCDWALGMMTDNLLGLPTSDNTMFYWTYFAAKRLPMFSW